MFKLQIFAVLLSLASQGVSVGCEEIGLDSYTNNVTKVKITQKDPLVAGQGFDIYDARDCIWRFHVPKEPTAEEKEDIYAFATRARTDSNRISIAEWRDTENTVAATIHNFVNSLNENSMLWLKKASEAFQYAGLLRSSHVHPQGNLNHPFGTANIILPPGKQKLGLVNPYRSPDNDATQNAELDHATSIGIVGLSGNLDPAQDYAYAFTFRLAEGLKHRFPKDVMDLGLPPPVEEFASYPRFQTGPWLKAERKGGECVVIDLRQVETYLKNTEPQKLSEVCNFARAAKRELESTMMPVSWAA